MMSFEDPAFRTALWVFIPLAAAALGSFFGARAARWEAEIAGAPLPPSVRSKCASCARTVPVWRMVPIVSWLAQKGRCGCPEARPLSRTYLACEAGAILFALAALAGWGASPQTLWLVLAGALAAWAAATDAVFGQVPDLAAAGLAAVGLGAAIFAPLTPLRGPEEAYLGAFLTGALLHLAGAVTTAWKGREALGLGDVKLGFGIGALIGPYLLGSFLAAAAGAGLLHALIDWARGGRLSDPRPFAPAMTIGAGLALAAERIGVLTA